MLHTPDTLGLHRWLVRLPLTILPLRAHIPGHVPRHKLVPLLAGMHCVEIRIRDVPSLYPVVRQQTDVAVAHQRLPQRLDAVLQMAFDHARWSASEGAFVVVVVGAVDILAK